MPLYPLRIDRTHFEILRESLTDRGYSEQSVCRRLAIPSIYDFKTLREGRTGPSDVSDSLDALIRLLMDQEAVEESILAAHLGEQILAAMRGLALTKTLAEDPSRTYADAVLYPQEGLFIASDRTFLVKDHRAASLPEDIVYASITRNTGRFVAALPDEPCERCLELCSGTGIGALIAGARYARRAWAADLSSRCTHFANFNARLNGIENFTALQGDLYAPVEGIVFDRIVAHPPYVPAEEQKLMFRDGGTDGEQILRGIVEGLPKFLSPGGRCYALTLATDREGETLEQRVRKWLGESQSDFDVFLVVNEAERRPNTILQAVVEAKGKLGELGPRSRIYEKLKVETILYGVVIVERHLAARAPLTGRCQKSRSAGSDAIEWFRRWRISSASPDFTRLLMKSRPALAPGLFLLVTHAAREGRLEPVEFRMRTDHALKSDARTEPWVAFLIGACDGLRTGAELFGYLREQDVITKEFSQEEFCGILKLLIESGFIEIAEFPLPSAPKRPAESSAPLVQ